jgi:heme oxygenase
MMPKAQRRNPRMRGLREDAQEALTRLAKLKTTTNSLKAAFDDAHKVGMEALKRRDFKALRNAIELERKAIEALSNSAVTPRRRRR